MPFGRERRYLTGIDWIVRVFDYMNRRATGAGNMFQIVMELDGVPAEDEVRECLDRFAEKFPVMNGRVRRDWRLAPYWQLPRRGRRATVRLNVHHAEDDADVGAILARGVNRPFASRREHVVFHLICAGEKGHVAVTFDHCLFDAHGAEAFLSMLEQEWSKEVSARRDLPVAEGAHLNQWRRKFRAGRQVNRAIVRLADNAPPRVLPLNLAASKHGFRFRVLSFSEQQSRDIMERVDDEAGYLMVMPYTMALTLQVLHGIFGDRGIEKGDYVIPVTVDRRTGGNVGQEVFFNHVSFLLFRIQVREVADFSALLDCIKQQMYDQVKAGLVRDIWEASFLMRIVPLPALSYVMRRCLKGELASFCFSFVGERGHGLTHFMGRDVRHSYHMTRVPIPPGLGVFFHQSRGRLNAYLSYAEGLLSEGEASAIVHSLKARLEGNGADKAQM